MAIIARNSITLAWQKDISSVTWYYKLQASTAAKPAKPTTATPSGWTTTEPTYTEGSTNSLYVCQKTSYSDGTFDYSDVSLSSSYEAAKAAYNKSVVALEAVTPIETRTYTGLIGSANNAADASFYFAKIHPDNYSVQWKVKLRILVTAPESYSQSVDIQFGGYGSTFSSYDSYTVRNTSLGIYYLNLYRATQAGIETNHKGHALGIGLRSATNPTTAVNARTVTVELLSVENCAVDMYDTAVKYASIDGTGTTNYSALTEMAVATAGQNATNNTNTNTSYTQYSSAVTAGANSIFPYSLIMKDSEKTWVSLTASGGNGTAKAAYAGGLIYDKVLYQSAGYTYASGKATGAVYDVYAVDLRYSMNCAQTLTIRAPIYLVGTIRDDGLYYLDTTQWWTQEEPDSEDGKTYIYLGETYSAYQVYLATENTAYQFCNGKFMKLEDIETMKAQESANNAQSSADSASSQAAENREAIRVQGLSLEAFREEIRLAVASLANGTQIFKGDPLEDYQTEEIPTLLNYPTFTDFFIWTKCGTNVKCSGTLICGTNNYAAHKNEIALCTTYNDFYQFRQVSGEYSWVQMTAAEIEELSNRYSFVSVDEDGVTIKSSKNNQTGELKVTSDGVIPSRIFCC